MKDKEARKDTRDLYKMVYGFLRKIDEIPKLEGISIKDCPKCKHEVMAKTYYIAPTRFPGAFICLSCGTKFTCSKVCKIVETDEK